MKQYLIDELRYPDYEKIRTYLNENFGSSDVNEICWIPIDKNLLTDIQIAHVKCQPHFFVVNLKPDSVAFELLVRTKNKIKCDCISYATKKQHNWLIRLADSIFDKLDIIT